MVDQSLVLIIVAVFSNNTVSVEKPSNLQARQQIGLLLISLTVLVRKKVSGQYYFYFIVIVILQCSGGSSGGGELRESLVGCGPKTLIDTWIQQGLSEFNVLTRGEGSR